MNPRVIAGILRFMRRGERLVLGLWVGILATDLAILASALPYIHMTDPKQECWSLGLSRLAIRFVPSFMLLIVILAIAFRLLRAGVARIRYGWGEIGTAAICSLMWVGGVLVVVFSMAWFLLVIAVLLRNPPSLPTNLPDAKACGEIVLKAKAYFPFGSDLSTALHQFFRDFGEMFFGNE